MGVAFRLPWFAAASLALHAIAFGAYSPTLERAGLRSGEGRALHATLTPAAGPAMIYAPSPDVQAAQHQEWEKSERRVSDRRGDDTASTADVRTQEDEPDYSLPMPDKWHQADELDTRAEPLTPVKLHYPADLAASRITGRVQIALFIDENGWVRKSRIIMSRPEASLGHAALHAWQHVRFSPATKDGIAVKSEKVLEIDFTPY